MSSQACSQVPLFLSAVGFINWDTSASMQDRIDEPAKKAKVSVIGVGLAGELTQEQCTRRQGQLDFLFLSVVGIINWGTSASMQDCVDEPAKKAKVILVGASLAGGFSFKKR